MINNCINCKYYNKGICNNKDLPITAENKTNDSVITFIEDGYLSEGIRESGINIKLNEIFKDVYAEAGALKKNINNKKIDSEVEDQEIYITELIDAVTSKLMTRYFKNNKSTKIKISDPYNFSCCMWE